MDKSLRTANDELFELAESRVCFIFKGGVEGDSYTLDVQKENAVSLTHDFNAEVYVYFKSYPGERENGDKIFIRFTMDKIQFAVVDGIGHGSNADHASQLIIDILSQEGHNLTETASLINRTLKGTRGAVYLYSEIDPAAKSFYYYGLGNIRMSCTSKERHELLTAPRGIAGMDKNPIRIRKGQLHRGSNLLGCFSDGIAEVEKELISERDNNELSSIAESIIEGGTHVKDDGSFILLKLDL